MAQHLLRQIQNRKRKNLANLNRIIFVVSLPVFFRIVLFTCVIIMWCSFVFYCVFFQHRIVQQIVSQGVQHWRKTKDTAWALCPTIAETVEPMRHQCKLSTSARFLPILVTYSRIFDFVHEIAWTQPCFQNNCANTICASRINSHT